MTDVIARSLAAVVCVLTLGSAAEARPSLQPSGWAAGLKLAEAVDVNADSHVVEINLEARLAQVEIVPGHPTEVWTYDGGLPGPLIRVRVGDRLIVHFKNQLPQPTTVHWHGVRVPIQMDGVPGISQPEVRPGESFDYDFVVPDAGLYWYHPHVMSAAQVGFGLYGALLVEDPAEQIGVEDELVMVLSDIEIDGQHKLESPDVGGNAGMVFGREGNHVLVNGREMPVLRARAGVPQRWRIVNAAKSRYFSIDADGATYSIIGGDGGLQEYPTKTDVLVLGPGERADVIVTPPGTPGSQTIVRSLLFDRGYGSTEFRDVPDLFTLDLSRDPAVAPKPAPTVRRAIEPLPSAGATPRTIRLTLTKRADGISEFGIDGRPYPNATHVVARLGETQLWTVVNDTKWAHPLHLHGFFFQVLDDKGEPARPLAWKDTVHIPAEKTLKLLVRFDDRAGEWMYHCHILDHADGGLMSTVLLGDVKPTTHTHRSR